MTRISTLITNYNHNRFLVPAIESVLAQTVASDEIIIVDDGSTDGSRDSIEALVAKHPRRLVPLFQENAGQGAALNAAFAASRGEVILLLDSDDLWDAGKIAAVLPALDRSGFVQHNLQQGSKPYRSFLVMAEHLRYLLTFGLCDFFVPTSGLCFRREVLDQLFPLPENPLLRICADAYLTRLSLFFTDLTTITAPLGTYRVHDANHWYLRKHRYPKRIAEILTLANAFLLARNLPRIPLERNWQMHGLETADTAASLAALRAMQAEPRQVLPATVFEGMLQLSLQRYPEALDAFERAVAVAVAPKGPGDGAVIPEDVRLLLDVAEAGGDMVPLGLDPAEAYYNIAVCLVRLGRYEQALGAFAQVLRHAPERLEIRLNRSDSLRYLGRYAEALAEVDLAEASDPNFPGIEQTRRKVYTAMAAVGLAAPVARPQEAPRGNRTMGLNIQLQTTSLCNGKCIICPYLDSWHKAHPGIMSDAVFERILAELAPRELGKICVYFENEPLADPKLLQRIARLQEALRFEHLEISTNAMLLDRDRANALADLLEGTDHSLWISFHGVDKRTYEGIMGLPFERVLANVSSLLTLAEARGLRVTIRGSGMPRDPALAHDFCFSEQQFLDFWNTTLDGLGLVSRPRLNFFSYHDRCGSNRRNELRLRVIPRPDLTGLRCPRVEGWLHFLYTGELSLCCMDYHREQVFGDIRTQSLAEILDSEPYRAVRDMSYGLRPSPPDFICKRCISPNG